LLLWSWWNDEVWKGREIGSSGLCGRLLRGKEAHSDMIVMGSRGLSDLAGLLVGSVSHKVTNMAPCTCITVR